MRRAGLVSVLVLAMWLMGAGPAAAQGSVIVAIDSIAVDSLPAVELRVTVRDANGVPITGLAKEQFELVEDGRVSFPPSEAVAQVNGESAISAMLVIDISGSMKGKPIDEAKKAARTFVDSLSAMDRAGLIAFCDKMNVDPDSLDPEKEVDFTTDKNVLRNVIETLDTKIGWDTPLYDAVYKGISLTAREPAGKRAVIVMTDGKDEADNAQGVAVADAGSLYAPDDPINEATRQGIPVFAIGVGNKIDDRYLSRLAMRTGGQYKKTPNPEEMTALFQEVLNQLKEQYVLRYETGLGEDNHYHSLMVRVSAPQGNGYDEEKFFLGGDATPTAVVVAAVSATQAAPAQDPTTEPTPEPTAEGFFEDVRTTIEDTIDENPGLAIAIGGGALLLIVLVIVLVVVLLRGRKGKPEMAAVPELEEPAYSPPPDFGAAATGARPPIRATPEDSKTVDWGGPPAAGQWGTPAAPPPAAGWGPSAPPPLPQWGTPGGAPPAGQGQAPADGTRIIDRGPKHLAMLVDKSRPDRKFDVKGTMNVGRAPDNQIVIDHPTVSRHHGWIKEEKGEFLVFDVGSANGTSVNGERISAPFQLNSGDVVRFGEVDFVFTRVF